MSQRELYYAVNGTLQRREIPVRELKPTEVRVEVHSVGINPADWKTIDNNLADGAGQGNDFSGTVIEIGSDVKSVRVGDTVAGGVGGGDVDHEENGAFTNLLNVEEKLLFKFPHKLVPARSDNLGAAQPVKTFEQAASLGIACDTAAIAFEGITSKPGEFALIYGASSSLGYIALQIAQNLGFSVIAVSAPNDELYKDLGVHFLDRNDPDWVENAKKLADDKIVFAFDTIGMGGSMDKAVEVCSSTLEATAVFNDPVSRPSEEVTNAKKNVVARYPVYYLLMQEMKKLGPIVFPKDEYLYNNCGEIISRINAQFAEEKLRTLAIKVLHGLDKLDDAMTLSRGGVRGTKIVVNVK